MKSALITLIALVATVSAMAGSTIRLNRDTEIRRGARETYMWLRAGTKLAVEVRSYMSDRSGTRLLRVIKVKNIDSLDDNRYYLAKDLNYDSEVRGVDFYITQRDYDRAVRTDRPSRPVRPTRPTRPTRPVVVPSRPRYDHDSYVRCYERPSRRVVEVNQSRRDRGNDRIAGGIFGAIAGQIVGGDVGDAISVIGAGVAIAGVVDLNNARSVVFEGGYTDCQRYYTRGQVRRDRRNNSCTVTRYYSNSWQGTTEYFERKCGRNQGSYHFHRSEVSW
jgi:hypothetical protein